MLLFGGGWKGFVFTLKELLKAVHLTFNLSLQIFFFSFRLPKPSLMTKAWSLALGVNILQGVTQWKGRVCAAELTVVSSFARPVCVHSTVRGSVAASLWDVARKTCCFQEVLKASETLGDSEPKELYSGLLCLSHFSSILSSGEDEAWLQRILFIASTWEHLLYLPMCLCLSLYCIHLAFSKVLTCVFLIMNVKEVSRAAQWLNSAVDVLFFIH